MKTVIEMILQCLVGAEGKGRTHGRLTLRLLRNQHTAATADYLMVFARKSFQQQRDVVAKLSVTDPALLQYMAGQNVDVAQKIDRGDLIGLLARESKSAAVNRARHSP
jgi:hypothetical protein